MQEWQAVIIGVLVAGISVGVILTGLSIFLTWVRYTDNEKKHQEASNTAKLPPRGSPTKTAS